MRRFSLYHATLGLLVLLVSILAGLPAYADFISGSTGADGEFAPTSNTVLQIPDVIFHEHSPT